MQEKKMSLMDLVFMGMGGCIGAGIFSMLGVGIGLTGRSVWLAFLIAMTFKMSQQVRMVVTASMFSVSGGTYSQSALVLTPALTGVNAYQTLTSLFSVSIFGISIADYLIVLVPSLAPYQKIVAAGVMLLFCLVGASGVNIFAKVQNALGICKVVALGLFIAFGLFACRHGSFEGEPFFINGSISFLTAIALMSFTCDGTTQVVNFGDQADDPTRTIPKAWAIASISCGIIYALLGYVGSHLAPYAEVANQNLGFLAQLVLPKPLYIFFILGGAMASLSTALLGSVVAMPNIVSGIAKDGWLPSIFKKRNTTILVMGLFAMLTIFTGLTLDSIVSIIMVTGTPLGLIINFRAMKLPERFPEAWANSTLKISPKLFKALMCVSMFSTTITGYFSLQNLTLGMAIGTVVITAGIFAVSAYLVKSGRIKIVSTNVQG